MSFHRIPFLTYAVITAITPGPNNIMSMTNGNRKLFAEHTKIVNTVLALLLVYCAITLFIS